MSKNKAKFFLNFMFIFFVIGIIFIIYNSNSIKADSDLGVFKSKKDFSIDFNGKKINFSINSYSKEGLNKNYLIVTNVFKIKRALLFGFEDNIDLCSTPVIKMDSKDILCLVGDVGVHSQNMVFIDVNMAPVKIEENGKTLKNITTDVPNYQLSDYNNDGTVDLIIDNRNYDLNPLTDIIRNYYFGIGDSFVFDKAERIEVK